MGDISEWALPIIRQHEHLGPDDDVTEEILRRGLNRADCTANEVHLVTPIGGTMVEDALSRVESYTYWKSIISLRFDPDAL